MKTNSTNLKKVLIAVDETKGSQSILSMFNNLVHPPEEVILLHVSKPLGKSLMADMIGGPSMSELTLALEGTEYQERLDAKGQKIIDYYTRELENGGLISVKPVLKTGIPEDEILAVAAEEEVDLMILGCNRRSWSSRLFTGSVSKSLDESASVPVVVVQQKGDKVVTNVSEESLARGEAYGLG